MLDYQQKDYLTRFFLRDTFYTFLKKLIADAKADGKVFSLLLIDLDHFKKFNDKYGHLLGDEVLKYAAEYLRLFFPGDLCFRYGGDEFIVILPDKDPGEALDLAVQLKHSMVARPFLFEDKTFQPFKVTFSCGVAGFPSDGQTTVELIKRADEAMYFSKRHGHNFTTLASKVKYIRLRNILVFLVSIGVIVGSVLALYHFSFKEIVHRLLRDAMDIRVTTEIRKDVVLLKNGGIVRGEIIEETNDQLTLNMYLKDGEGLLVLNKSEIAEIRRSTEK